MSNRLRAFGGASLITLLVGSACTFKNPESDPGGTAGSDSAGGRGGRSGSSGASARAGSTSKGGKGGTSGTAGKASAGNTNEGGTAGTNIGAGGADGGAGGAPSCPGCASGFCLDDGTCVTCLASNDHCPVGQFCTDGNECESGCKADGSTCASGSCDDEHNCTNCINDDECVDGLVCGAGQCGAACSLAQEGQQASCGDGLTCCSLHCSDIQTDSDHCGACGADCQAGQFCGIDACAHTGEGGAGGASSGSTAPCVTCHPTTLANLCAVARLVVILDTNKNLNDGNRTAGQAIGAALRARCSPQPELTEAEQDSVEALNITTGRPVSGGGELLVVAGGPFFQNLEGYVEDQRVAPIYWNATNVDTEFRKSSDGSLVVSLPLAGDHESHDLFLIQFMRDAASGSLVLNAQGFWLSGTVAATYQINNAILPSLSNFDKGWYVYEWTDMNADKLPDLNEISLKASGP